jgi:mono/diheme cytochrome c family protein
MKKALKFIGYLLVFLIIALGGLIVYAKTMLPNVGAAPALTVTATARRIEHGKYLANCVNSCMDCHSKRDWSKFSGPLIPETFGMGGERFDQQLGLPGAYFSRNITPKGISRYTDGELFRAITTGVTKEGHAMFPIMPYPYYGKMDPKDIYDIIAYIRTLPGIDNTVPESSSDFPMNIIINSIPSKGAPTKRPDTSDKKAYGAYLVNASGCIECHTQADKGQIIKDLAFSGGRAFIMPDGSTVRSSNITSDPATGIGSWTEDAFINRFKAYADSAYVPQPVAKGAFNTMMPWMMYGHMTRSDLSAIYTYIHSLPAKVNTVNKFSPAVAVR